MVLTSTEDQILRRSDEAAVMLVVVMLTCFHQRW